MKGYGVSWVKGNKTKVMSENAVFGTKKEASGFLREVYRINPKLKAEMRMKSLKLKIRKI